MIYISEIALLGCTAAMAWWQSRLIAAGRPILHGLWGSIYAALIAAAVFLLRTKMTLVQDGLYTAAAGGAHLIAFNILLNRFRGLPWKYTSQSTGSILDKIELWAFGPNVWIMEIVVAAISITLQFWL